MFEEWKQWTPVYFALTVNTLQWILDRILDATIGYTTKYGWKSEREDAKNIFTKSAQLVRMT